jgi:tetratricopeptide (TPR) repeat protein
MIGCGWKWWEIRRFRHAMTEIEAEMGAGRHGIAARNLAQLMVWSPDSDQAAYLLGVCERARRRNQAAAAAWARVTPGSPFSASAIEARMSLFLGGGQLAAAEQLIFDAAEDPRNDRTALRILLLPTFSQQGRLEDASRLVVERWEHLRETGEDTSELAINLARLHIELQGTPNPVEAVRAGLEQAARLAPDDDRVWLGRANLAIRTGNFDEAERWLDACQRRRLDDIPVWRARLSWAMATCRADAVREALVHLPARESSVADIHRIRAWLGAQQGDHGTEREELERLLALEPADLPALKRLVELARYDGRPEGTAEFRARAAEIDRLSARYQKLYERKQPIRDAAEMGDVAEELGRPFEARVFLSVAAAESLNRNAARRVRKRLSENSAPLAKMQGTLAEVIAPEPNAGARMDVNYQRAVQSERSH